MAVYPSALARFAKDTSLLATLISGKQPQDQFVKFVRGVKLPAYCFRATGRSGKRLTIQSLKASAAPRPAFRLILYPAPGIA